MNVGKRGRTFRESLRRAAVAKQKSPRPGPGALFAHTAGFSLPADLEAGSATSAAANGAASTVTVGDHLDPKCILVLEVRGVAGLAQRIQAVLRRTRGCGGEPRQLEDHPRAGIHFRQDECCLLYTSPSPRDS